MTTPQALLSSESTEWYTPPHVIAAVRQVLGRIELDPASCDAAQITVQATRFFTLEDDGLTQHWFGAVFLNPPYGKTRGKSNQAIWTEYLIDQYERGTTTEAIALVNAVPGEKWFQALWDYPICFTRRMKFVPPPGSARKNSPTHGSALVYFGRHPDRFQAVFEQLGTVVERRRSTSDLLRALGRG